MFTHSSALNDLFFFPFTSIFFFIFTETYQLRSLEAKSAKRSFAKMDLNKFHVTLSLTSKFLIQETGFPASSSSFSTTTATSFFRMRLRAHAVFVDPVKGTFNGYARRRDGEGLNGAAQQNDWGGGVAYFAVLNYSVLFFFYLVFVCLANFNISKYIVCYETVLFFLSCVVRKCLCL